MKADLFLSSPGLEGLLTLTATSRRTVAQPLLQTLARGVGGRQHVQERGGGGGGGHPPTHALQGETGREPAASARRPHRIRAGRANWRAGQTRAAAPTGPPHCRSSARGPGWRSPGRTWWCGSVPCSLNWWLFIHSHKQNEKANEMRVVLF